MIKTRTIKVVIIIKIKIIIKTLMIAITIIIMMIMIIKIGNYQLSVAITNFDSSSYYYYYQNLLFTVQVNVKSLLSKDAGFNQ